MPYKKPEDERRDQRITLKLSKKEARAFQRIVSRERLPAGTTLYRMVIPLIEAEAEQESALQPN